MTTAVLELQSNDKVVSKYDNKGNDDGDKDQDDQKKIAADKLSGSNRNFVAICANMLNRIIFIAIHPLILPVITSSPSRCSARTHNQNAKETEIATISETGPAYVRKSLEILFL